MKTSRSIPSFNLIMINKEIVETALKAVKYPGFSRDIVSFGLVENITVHEQSVAVRIKVTTADDTIPPRIKESVESVLGQLDGIASVTVDIIAERPKSAGAKSTQPSSIPGVKKIVAVASGKGGVGKSTVAVNLACAIDRVLQGTSGYKGVGILDCDIYGPSVPLMMGIHSRPEIQDERLIPPQNYGIQVMSMALLIDEDSPVIWRGPMINNAISQFAQHVNWGELDVLVVDLPPGTGDAQLSLVQTLPVDGAVIVTTPQAVAVNVTRRGAMMFEKVNVPILGVCENMSYLEAPDGQKVYVFGEGGGQWTAESLGAPLLGQIPLDIGIREGGDRGIPVSIAYPQGQSAQVFGGIASQVIQSLGLPG